MKFKGQRIGEKKITHTKKKLDLGKYSKDAVTFEDLIMEINIDPHKYENILKCLLKNKKHSIQKRINDQKLYDYTHFIIYELARYGFRYIDISYLFMDEISTTSIGKWANSYKNKLLKQKPIQVEIPREQECIPEYQSWTNLLNDTNINELANVLFQHKLYLWHIHKNKILTIKNAKNLKSESRKK